MTTLVAILPTMGPAEMLIVALLAVLLFGSKLPDVARQLGRQMAELKRGISGFEQEFRSAANSATNTSTTNTTRSIASRTHDPVDDRDELTAPKFQPPQSAPHDAAATDEAPPANA